MESSPTPPLAVPVLWLLSDRARMSLSHSPFLSLAAQHAWCSLWHLRLLFLPYPALEKLLCTGQGRPWGPVTHLQAPRAITRLWRKCLPQALTAEWAAETSRGVCYSREFCLWLHHGVELTQGFRPVLGSCHLFKYATDSPLKAGQEVTKA